MKVRFSAESMARLQAIADYIRPDSPKAADAMLGKLIDRAHRIADLPRAGRTVPEYRIDELREVLERPYRIIYRIRADEIEVVTIMHYRRLLPGDLI